MILTAAEYSKKFLFKGKEVSPKTIIRRCEKGMLPCNHHATQLPGDHGQWVIEVPDKEEAPKVIVTKTDLPKPDLKLMSKKYYSFNK